jgi:hypothetical protein
MHAPTIAERHAVQGFSAAITISEFSQSLSKAEHASRDRSGGRTVASIEEALTSSNPDWKSG